MSGVSGSGVSGGSANPDLDVLIAGGDAFLQRIQELKDAKTNFDAALTNMNLGKSAVDAMNEAARVLGEAKEKRDADMAALAAQIQDAQYKLNAWSAKVTQDSNDLYAAATQANNDAQALKVAAAADRALASSAVPDAQAKANSILDDANATASKIISDAQAKADNILSDATILRSQAQAAMDSANQIKADFSAKLATLQNAAAAVSG
jgi:hypothetical protein